MLASLPELIVLLILGHAGPMTERLYYKKKKFIGQYVLALRRELGVW